MTHIISRMAAGTLMVLTIGSMSIPATAQQRPQSDRQGHQTEQQRGTQDRDRDRSDRDDRTNAQGDQRSGRSSQYRVTSTVNLRSGPGTDYRRVGQVRAGRTIQVDQTRNGWLHVRNQGWISARFARRT